jgi:citrate synthase
MSEPGYSPGLEGVIAGETAVSSLEGGLRYRGYPVGELVEHATFDEVAFLLLYGDLPDRARLAHFRQRLGEARSLPAPLVELLRALPPAAAPMDAARTSVSVLAHFDPDTDDNSRAASLRKAERLLAQVPVAVAAHDRLRRGLDPVPSRPDLGHSASFLYLVRGTEARPDEVRTLDVAEVLYAEHELNTATFAARLACSTKADLHAAVVAAIATLKGPWHGGANEKVKETLEAAGSPDRAEPWVRERLARKERVMGFGHRIHKAGDERAALLKPHARRAAEAAGLVAWEETAEVIERVLAAEKQLYPNIDWPAARLFQALGLPGPLYPPLFVLARVAGWCAHAIEQHEHNRLIQPQSRYTGPALRHVVPLDRRG